MDGRDYAWRNRAPGPHAHRNTARQGYGRPVDRGARTAKTVKRPWQQPAHPQYGDYWALLRCKRHTMPHSAQPQHTKYWAPRTRKQHQQEHQPQRPTESSNPTQHAKGRTGDCPGPGKEQQPDGMSHRGGSLFSLALKFSPWNLSAQFRAVPALCASSVAAKFTMSDGPAAKLEV